MDQETLEISTKLGKLRGLVKKSFENALTYYSFQGIPYGKPPIGDLRFKAPEPYGQWKGVLDSTKEGNDAAQTHMLFQNLIGDENCLFLNVYCPQKPSEDGVKKAVMVFVHGGGFKNGSGSTELYGPDFLIGEDIVLVTLNYRVGALGFLSLENEIVPGNNGLKDQALALRWVQDNISSFGGDPNNVTLFGESAGAVSVHYHMLSPQSRGLFHKAILQSGTSLCQWALQTKPREKALHLASLLGCDSQDDKTVLEFLQSVSAVDIIKHQASESLLTEKENLHKLGLCFIPCVEVVGKTPFLPDFPRRMMERGEFTKVPVIIGVNDKEGLLAVALNAVKCERVNEDISVMVPFDLNIPVGGSEEEKVLGREILKFYTNKDPFSWNIDDVIGYVNFITDVEFAWANENTRQWFLKHMSCPVYSYVFTYIKPHTIFSSSVQKMYPEMASRLCASGACHGDEQNLLFKTNLSQIPLGPSSSDDKLVSKKLSKAWTTFAKTGDPNCTELGVVWRPDSIQNPNFVDLGKIWKVVEGTFSPKREQFWSRIYDKYSYLY